MNPYRKTDQRYSLFPNIAVSPVFSEKDSENVSNSAKKVTFALRKQVNFKLLINYGTTQTAK